jgi:hypothetical protein
MSKKTTGMKRAKTTTEKNHNKNQPLKRSVETKGSMVRAQRRVKKRMRRAKNTLSQMRSVAMKWMTLSMLIGTRMNTRVAMNWVMASRRKGEGSKN